MAKCYHINTTRWSNTCYVRTSKISSGRLFLVAASPYASKYGGLRINSTNPAHKKHIASRKCKTCIPPENLSLHVLSRKQNGKATIDGMAERVWITGKCMCSYLAPELSSGFQTNCKREICSNHTLCRVSWHKSFAGEQRRSQMRGAPKELQYQSPVRAWAGMKRNGCALWLPFDFIFYMSIYAYGRNNETLQTTKTLSNWKFVS